MASPAKVEDFLDLVKKSGVTDDKRLDAHVAKLRQGNTLPKDPPKLAGQLIADGYLTQFQAEQILQGKWRRFVLGKYKILEPLGSGGMGSVYLCEHKLMRRRVAVKVLPPAKAKDESALARFYREARAVAALDHPNIVHAYDIDQDGDLHFLIMEYVDGASLQEIIKRSGPMEILRACHYMRQSALGLDQAHQKSLVHRDIKPGNILVDRTGVVKILDMGLARFFNDEDDILTRKFDENVLGTADYLAPEQIDDSHTVDIRADIYSLGATFYYILTGKTLFGEGTIGQKLLWHQNRQPKPVAEVRPDVPAELSAIIMKMLAKAPEQRFQTPAELSEVLTPFTQTPIGPPPDIEMPKLSPAATGMQPTEGGGSTIVKSTGAGGVGPGPIKALQGLGSSRKAGSSGSGQTGVAASSPPMVPGGSPGPAAIQAPAADVEAEWEKIAADTPESNALVDTSRDKKSSRVMSRGQIIAQVKETKRLKIVMAAVGLTALIGLIIGLVFLFRPDPNPVEPVKQIKQVTEKASGPRQYKTIQAALRDAVSGDVIELVDPVYQENVLIDRAMDVTLKAAANQPVTWKPGKKGENVPLLRLANAGWLKFLAPGITMDGEIAGGKRVDHLISIFAANPGLTIDGLHLKGFAKSAISVTNAIGEKGHPMRLTNLTVLGDPKDKSLFALYFDAKPNIRNLSENDYLEVSSCEFNGLAIHAPADKMGKNIVGVPIQN